MCSYTSSVTITASCSVASAPIRVSCSRVNTAPVGLCGVLTSTSRVRAEKAARSSSGSKANVGGRSGTARSVAPDSAIVAA